MAEDVLRAAGFKHGVNYVTQRTLPNGARPDVTFLLPGDLHLHMDVKFPLANYLAMLECDGEADREALPQGRSSATSGHGSGSWPPAATWTVRPARSTACCCSCRTSTSTATCTSRTRPCSTRRCAQDVVLCSPSTLFAVLAVIRQSCDTLALQRTSDEILGLLGGFSDQWGRYTDEVDKLGRQLDTVATHLRPGSAARGGGSSRSSSTGSRRSASERGVEPVVVDEGRPRLLHLRGDDGSGATWDEGPPALPTASSG